MLTRRFEYTFWDAFRNFERKMLARPLNLGGSSGTDGGAGGPPGGFIGWLPQTRVAYDTTELASSGVPASGESLLDNLNHIRYRIETLESGGGLGQINVYQDDTLVASGVNIVNFEGGVDVTDDGGGQVTVIVSGLPTDELVKVSSNDTTTDYLDGKITAGSGITISILNEGGNEQLEITSTALGTDELIKVSSNDTTASYLENKITTGSGITVNVLNEGGNEQLEIIASGLGVDELVKISSNDTTANYLQSKVTAGSNVIISILNEGSNEEIQISAAGSGLGTDELVKVHGTDTTPDYLYNKISAGNGINVSIINYGGDEQLEIESYGGVPALDPYTIPFVNSSGELVDNTQFQLRETINGPNIIIGGDYDPIEWMDDSRINSITNNGEYNAIFWGFGYEPILDFMTSRGTQGTPVVMSGGDWLASINFGGYAWNDYLNNYWETGATIAAFTNSSWNAEYKGSMLDFRARNSDSAYWTIARLYDRGLEFYYDDGAIYFGERTIEGSHRIRVYGGNIVHEELIGAAWVIESGGGGGAITFLDLTDTPTSYFGHGTKLVGVNSGETGLEFVTASGLLDTQIIFAGEVLLDETAPAGGQATFDLQQSLSEYSYIEITINGKSEIASQSYDNINLWLNNDTTNSHYRRQRLTGSDSTAESYGGDQNIAMTFASSQNYQMSGSAKAIILDPGSSFYKIIQSTSSYRISSSDALADLRTVQWEDSSAISRITLELGTLSDFAVGTRCIIVGYKEVEVGGATLGHDPVTLSSDLANYLLDINGQELDLLLAPAKQFFAGPTVGGPYTPSFRAITAGDLATGGDSTKYLRGDMTWQVVDAGVGTFLELTDTPSSYAGQAGNFPVVNSGETGLEFITISGISTIERNDLYWSIDGALASGVNVAVPIVVTRDSVIDSVLAYVENPGVSGVTILDIEKNGTSIFTTKPTITYDDADSFDEVIPTTINLAKGDILSLNLDSVAIDSSTLVVDFIGHSPLETTNIYRQVTFTIDGVLVNASGKIHIPNKIGVDASIIGVYLYVDTPPTGDAIIVDINIDSTTIFTTQANRPTIAVGQNAGQSENMDVTTWASGTYLTADIDQIGSLTAGSDITITVKLLV